jgi:hypothetical protein
MALLFGLLVPGSTRAQEPPAGRQEKPQPDTASLERRLADLQAEIVKLRKEVQSLRTERNTPPVSLQPGGKTVVDVFTLKHAKAAAVAKALHDLFPEKDGLTLRIASEPNSNTLVVRGSREELDMIEAIITKLEAVAQEQSGK